MTEELSDSDEDLDDRKFGRRANKQAKRNAAINQDEVKDNQQKGEHPGTPRKSCFPSPKK
eukprot:8080046-Heterocapsa_arctica.AAC.1